MTNTRKTRTVQSGYNEAAACDAYCGRRAQVKVQISTPNGRNYRTCGHFCNNHATVEFIAESIKMAELFLDS